MLIDEFLPTFEHAEVHELRIAASADHVERTLLTLDMSASPLVRVLFALRGLPARSVTFDRLADTRFVRLAYEPQRELVLGLIGRFWRVRGDLRRFRPEEFRSFDAPGWAKSAWNFSLAPDGGATLVRTETRVHCTDARSRRRFALYWAAIRPFSGLVRMEILRLLRRAAESPAGTR